MTFNDYCHNWHTLSALRYWLAKTCKILLLASEQATTGVIYAGFAHLQMHFMLHQGDKLLSQRSSDLSSYLKWTPDSLNSASAYLWQQIAFSMLQTNI